MRTLFIPAILSVIAPLCSFSDEFPTIIDFGEFKYFQENLLQDTEDSWTKKIAKSAFNLGYTAFNDSPEIGTFIVMLQQQYQIPVAIETGTFIGATSTYFSLFFDEVHTVEASEKLYTEAKERLSSQPNITCHLGSSENVLKKLLPPLSGKRLLLYLDAHLYNSWPLLDELEEISKTHKDNCIIVIDDIHLPGTNMRGCVCNGIELTPSLIASRLQKIFTKYTYHFLIPKDQSRAVKMVIIPKKWEESSVSQGKVDIISGFNIYDFPIKLSNVQKAGYAISMQYAYPYVNPMTAYDPKLKKTLVFGDMVDQSKLASLPKEKLVLVVMEPGKIPLNYYDYFSRVYTWDDDLVDNVKFFKIYYPYLSPMRHNLEPFEAKKFCVMISGSDNEYPERPNELYSERMKMVEFFEAKPLGEFDLFGRFWVKRHYRDFKGAIPGHHSGEEKISTLSNYRFCICFENTKEIRGYITEKIFACFTAGCIPVYWGASNIEDYIPNNCFIDFRKFKDAEELYQYMKGMSKETYEGYLNNIRTFIKSEKAQLFSPSTFENIIYEAITQ